MPTNRIATWAVVLVLIGAGALSVRAASPALAPSPRPTAARLRSGIAQSSPAEVVRPVVDKYCIGCHNDRRKAQYANLSLESLETRNIGAQAETWEKVLGKLRAGTMPPGGAARPDNGTYKTMVASLETALDRASAEAPNPGRPVIHRLNREEYVNAIRDLLGLDIDGPSLLPADNSGFGFDNIGDVLSMSPALLDRYVGAARKISRLTMGDAQAIRPANTIYRVPTLLVQEERRNDDLPFGTRGGIAVRHEFPLDGEYVVRVDFRKDYADYWQGLHEENVIDVRLDGVRVKQFRIDKSEAAKGPMALDGEQPNTGPLELRLNVNAGSHALSVALHKTSSYLIEGVGPDRLPISSTSYTQSNATSPSSGRIEMGVQTVEVLGPFNAKASMSESRRRVLVCSPRSAAAQDACARTILTKLARRAYRRTATPAELDTLLTFYSTGQKNGGFETGIETALRRILVAPAFLFRAERGSGRPSGGAGNERVSAVDLASRLSFFLWSSIPDTELLDLAENGRLNNPVVLEQQVKRMLAEPRGKAWIRNFFGQWLMLRNVQSQLPDYLVYPSFDDSLREAFRQETELFLDDQVVENRNALELLRANYTFVNERLARHYGIPGVYGSRFRRVELVDGKRAGLLGQGGILTVTAYPDRTSPVLRGKWLLENILGTPPPQPPKNVPPFPENDPKSAPKSVRARMEMHRKNPVCASCHTMMDPLGFGLENFDGIGRWRDTDAGAPIDASGQFPNGRAFTSAADFRQGILDGYADEFLITLTKKLTTYALGRGVEYYDMPAIRKIVRDAAANDYRWSAIITGIVKSTPFQFRRINS